MAMSKISIEVNKYFSDATKNEIDSLLDQIVITEHQRKVFEMKYIERRDVDYIAYTTGYSKSKIENDLMKIRKKIYKVI